MAGRQSIAPPRNLSLTEELEKLEQSITLTLQEIDSNFAKAHRIVTTSILPIVDRYARNSEAVWEGSKFWKQFFEASANVSLSNYEEPAIDEQDSTVHPDAEGSELSTTAELLMSPAQGDEDVTITSPPPKSAHTDEEDEHDPDDPLLTSPSIPHSHSTPRPTRDQTTKLATVTSPFENIRREMRGNKTPRANAGGPITPGKRPPALPDMTMTPAGSSPFAIAPGTASKKADANQDTILHQGILGKTYRTKATPLAKRRHVVDLDMSSPLGEDPEPQLRAEIFSSPMKSPVKARPGVSVATGERKEAVERWRERRRSSKGVPKNDDDEDFGEATRGRNREALTARSILGWGSDDDDDIPEMSPPKTMRFEFGEGRLIQTPAREASKRIVEDLLLTAGGDIDDELPEEYSPSIVMKGNEFQDETF